MYNNNISLKNYHAFLNVVETQEAIQLIKNKFVKELTKSLSLSKVSAPLFVESSTGLNDYLNGETSPICFTSLDKQKLEVVQSLAKWKRVALKRFGLSGLYADLIAVRPKEQLDNTHSLYVDQWDWEKVIKKNERNSKYLKDAVKKIYRCIVRTNKYLKSLYPVLKLDLPDNITFITSEELLKRYPRLTAKQRESAITKKYRSVFVMNIGCKLSNGSVHDDRAADYDDWSLNGDILIWNPILNAPFEISSMGIRVDKKSLLKQLKEKDELHTLNFPYYQNIINGRLPLTIGGGIGQSRLCMLLLQKIHIGEIQASYWSKKEIENSKKYKITLL